MTKQAGATGGQALMFGGAAVVVAAVVGAYFLGWFTPAQPVPSEPVKVAQPITPEPAAEPKPEAKPEPAPAPEPAVVVYDPPAFDVVRVEPDGSTLIAGRAAFGSELEILVDAASVAQTKPAEDGKFAAFVTIEPSEQPRVLSLLMRIDGQEVVSDQTVIIAPVVQVAEAPAEEPKADEPKAEEPKADTPAAEAPRRDTQPEPAQVAEEQPKQSEPVQPPAETQPAAPADVAEPPKEEPKDEPTQVAKVEEPAQTPPAAEPTAEPVAEQPAPAEQPAEPAAEPAQEPVKEAPKPKAPAVILADKDGVKVIQPAAAEPEVTVVIDAISYTETGDVTVAGRGKSGNFVQIYLNNASVGSTGIAEDGKWQTVLAAIAPGVYTLRVDEVDETGKVLSRIETPFKREAPEVLAKAAPSPEQPKAPPVRVVTVQPGSTLWAIAREKYGDGILYVRVYEANKNLIRNPDLIYPGQVFVVPE